MEQSIAREVREAKQSESSAEKLILRYSPFIHSETAKFLKRKPTDSDDELNIARLAFYEAIRAYDERRGAFLSFAALAIRNRLTDFYRKENRHRAPISLDEPVGREGGEALVDRIPDPVDPIRVMTDAYTAAAEIAEFAADLASFGLTLTDVADACPKQDRTFGACMDVLDYARRNQSLLDRMLQTKKLPIKELSKGARVEKKTLERHRQYLIAILLAYTNGYDIIRGHLSLVKRRGAAK